MDGVIIFFRDADRTALSASVAELGHLNQHGCVDAPDGRHCWLRPYAAWEWQSEYEPEEWAEVIRRLGGVPTHAVALCCNHGPNAVFALAVACRLMACCPSALLDDDRGGLLDAGEVLAQARCGDAADLFGLHGGSR